MTHLWATLSVNNCQRQTLAQRPTGRNYAGLKPAVLDSPTDGLDVQRCSKHDVSSDGGSAFLELLFKANIPNHLCCR